MSENVNEESNKEICPYCQKEIEDQFFDDHMMCHELEMEEKNNNNENNNINNQENNNNRNNRNTNNTNNTSNNQDNIISKLFNMFGSSNQENNSNNNNRSNQNNQSSSSSTNNITGLISSLLNFGSTDNNNNNQNRNNSNNNSNNNNDQEGSSQLGNLFSSISKTISGISELTSQLNTLSNQMSNTHISNDGQNYAPPPVPSDLHFNNNPQFPSNFIFPSNFGNINIIPPIIIGSQGHIFNPMQQRNNINIDEIMNLLPSSVLNEKKEGENNNCIICLADFEIGDNITSLPCLHLFHIDCIKHWLESKNHCPICKLEITADSLRRGG